MNNVFGVDVDEFAVENLRKTLGSSQKIVHADFLKIDSPKGAFVPNNTTALPLADAIVCNPSYTKHQKLDHGYKEETAKIIEKDAGYEISKQSSLYVHFFIHAAQFLKEKGRMAFITPSSFLDVNYGVSLKRFLLDNFRIVTIIVFSERKLLFPRVLTTTCMSLLEKSTAQESKDHAIKFLTVDLPLYSDRLFEITGNLDLLEKRDWDVSPKRIAVLIFPALTGPTNRLG